MDDGRMSLSRVTPTRASRVQIQVQANSHTKFASIHTKKKGQYACVHVCMYLPTCIKGFRLSRPPKKVRMELRTVRAAAAMKVAANHVWSGEKPRQAWGGGVKCVEGV